MTKTANSYRHTYNSAFFRWAVECSHFSANQVTNLLARELKPRSILDIGCGRGIWLSAWAEHGVPGGLGVDGAYVLDSGLLVSPDQFVSHDLCLPLDLGRTFDLVQSLEVAEHLPESCAEIFVDSLCRHGRRILFSAARPGQGGENHINEQPPDYWRHKFAQRGYHLFDFLRPALAVIEGISWWYLYNMFLYVAEDQIDSLPEAIKGTLLPRDKPIEDNLPLAVRLRCSLVSLLPQPMVSLLAQLKARLTSS